MPKLADVTLVPFDTKRLKIGQLFGRLKVKSVGKVSVTKRYYAVCDCRCGAKGLLVQIAHLEFGSTKSCGCETKDRMITHGLSGNPVFKRWQAMMQRCYDQKFAGYPNYGGRGIRVCKRWHNPRRFVSDMSKGFKPELELDRRNNDGDYRPSNCRWIPKSNNVANRRITRLVTYRGETHPLADWAKRTGIHEKLLRKRLFERGWSAERAFATSTLTTVEAAKIANAASQIKKRSA